MTTFYLSGQNSFGNRGCEAIVRSTVKLINKEFAGATILVPSNNIELDKAQWPDAASHGVEFVSDEFPFVTRFWAHFQRIPFRFIKQASWPFGLSQAFLDNIESADVVLSVGGDNYSLDYRLPSLLVALDQAAHKRGKVSALFGASVGPFEREPDYVPFIQKHLAAFDQLWVRESVSVEYLKNQLTLTNVHQMADPAFCLDSELVDLETYWPANPGDGVLGINVSPLIESYRKPGQPSLKVQVAEFIGEVLNKTELSVLLVPHVMPLDGSSKNNDAHYMQEIYASLNQYSDRLGMLPEHFNAGQLKFAIKQLRFFIGARTHSTIAALSSLVPTVSIAYSVKAKGINRDLFDSDAPVLPTSDVSKATLLQKLSWMRENEKDLKARLEAKIPEFQKSAEQAMKTLGGLVD